VLKELYRLNKVDFKLGLEISNSIEASFQDANSSRDDLVDMIKYLDLKDRLEVAPSDQVVETLFGREFLQNTFFRDLRPGCQYHILKRATITTFNSGEYVYSYNQPSDKSSSRLPEFSSSSLVESAVSCREASVSRPTRKSWQC